MALVQFEETDLTHGGAFSVGTELFLDRLFRLETRSRYGVSVQFGQAIGRIEHDQTFETSAEDVDGNAVNLQDYPRLNEQVTSIVGGPHEPGRPRDESRASLTVGFGFHIYF